MQLSHKNAIKKKKVMVVILHQTKNNLFCNILTKYFNENILERALRRRIKSIKTRLFEIEKIGNFYSQKVQKKKINLKIVKKIKILIRRKIAALILRRSNSQVFSKKNLFMPKLALDQTSLENLTYHNYVKINPELYKRNYFFNIFLLNLPKTSSRNPKSKFLFSFINVKKIKIKHKSKPYKFKLKKKFTRERYLQFINRMLITNQMKKHQLHLYGFRNTFVKDTLDFFFRFTKQRNRLVKSNGSVGFSGPHRQTTNASSMLGLKIGRFIKKKKFRDFRIVILLRSPMSRNIRAFFRGLYRVRPIVYFILPNYSFAHYRKRSKKRRRV